MIPPTFFKACAQQQHFMSLLVGFEQTLQELYHHHANMSVRLGLTREEREFHRSLCIRIAPLLGKEHK